MRSGECGRNHFDETGFRGRAGAGERGAQHVHAGGLRQRHREITHRALAVRGDRHGKVCGGNSIAAWRNQLSVHCSANLLVCVVYEPDGRRPLAASQLRLQRVLVGKAQRDGGLRPLHQPIGGLGHAVIVHNGEAEAGAELEEVPRADAVDRVVLLAPESLRGVIQNQPLIELRIAHQLRQRARIAVDPMLGAIEHAEEAGRIEAGEVRVGRGVDGQVEPLRQGGLDAPLLRRSEIFADVFVGGERNAAIL